jgi:hypothetical protein
MTTRYNNIHTNNLSYMEFYTYLFVFYPKNRVGQTASLEARICVYMYVGVFIYIPVVGTFRLREAYLPQTGP